MIYNNPSMPNIWGEQEVQQAFKNYNHTQFYQLFNQDEYNWIDLHTNFKFPQKGFKLNKLYYDIETYTKNIETLKIPFDAENSYYPVNAIATYHNVSNTAHIFVWLQPEKFENHELDHEEILQGIWEIYNDVCEKNKTYVVEDLDIQLHIHDSEFSLLKHYFQLNKELNPLFVMGFNSFAFDDPYTIKRLQKNTADWENIVSEFGQVKKYGELSFEFPDYNFADLQVLYKPVDSGGNGYGSSLPSYNLNGVAFKELGIEKLELEENFIYSYENNICNYLCYNLLDTLIVYKIDDKLTFLEQIASLARINVSTLSSSVKGRSIMYGLRNHVHFTKERQLIRAKKHSSEVLFGLKNPHKKSSQW